MALVRRRTPLRVITAEQNTRYHVRVVDEDRAFDLGMEAHEALAVGAELIRQAGDFDHEAAVKAVTSVIDSLMRAGTNA